MCKLPAHPPLVQPGLPLTIILDRLLRYVGHRQGERLRLLDRTRRCGDLLPLKRSTTRDFRGRAAPPVRRSQLVRHRYGFGIVITGSQIRAARNLLGWDRKLLARAYKLRPETLARAESVDGEPPITVAHARAIRSTLEQAGIEFRTGASAGVVLPRAGAA